MGASVAVNKRFSKFTCDYWFQGRVLTSFIFEKNLSTHAVLRGKINIRWSSFKQLGKIIAQALSFKHVEYNLCASRGFWSTKSFFLSRFCNSLVSFEIFFSLALCFSNIYLRKRGHSSIAFNCSYTIHIPNLVYSNGFTRACFFFTVVID